MCIALSVAFAFQYLINRSPARKLLRQATADLISSVTGYVVLHVAFVSACKSRIMGPVSDALGLSNVSCSSKCRA